MLNKNYNSNREHLVLPEYGRHIFKIVRALCEIEDDERRNIEAKRVIDIMGNINPGLRDSPMFRHKLWDHLFIMSDFKLEIDSPYPKPTREALVLKPRRLEYPKKRFTHKQYGNHIREVLNKLKNVEDNDDHVQTVAADVARFMKYKSYEYNQEYPCNDVIVNDIKNFTEGGIVLEESVLRDTKPDYNAKKNIPQRTSGNGAAGNNGKKSAARNAAQGGHGYQGNKNAGSKNVPRAKQKNNNNNTQKNKKK